MTAQGILGEVLPQSRRLCTASADLWLNGQAIDAGTAIILDSNLSQQSRESLHQLACALGPGGVYPGNTGGAWDNLLDNFPQTNPATPLYEVAWTQRRGMCFGPFDLTSDLRTADGNTPRKIRVRYDVHKGASESLTVYTAITQGPGIPQADTIVASGSAALTGTGRAGVTSTHQITPSGTARRRCAESPIEYGPYADLYVWIAWKSTNEDDAIYAVSVWEVR